MKPAIAFVVLLALAAAVLIAIPAGHCQPGMEKATGENAANKVDLDLDRGSVIQIAEVVLVRVYGKEVLQERPWIVTRTGDTFKIEGKPPEAEGGVAEILIDRKNAAVLSISHGK